MPRSRSIRVTVNLEQCLKELKAALKEMPSNEAKKRASRALAYLEKTFKGEPQPLRGSSCPKDTTIFI
jgi:hypothetical protein